MNTITRSSSMGLVERTATHPELSISPLSWLKGEIDFSLGVVRENLSLLTTGAGSRQELASCGTHLRQVRGALQMLGYDGATRFCELLEEAVRSFENDSVRVTTKAVAVVDRAVFALTQFLDELSNDDQNVPLKLFPVYREMGELLGKEGINEKDLFFPDVRPAAPSPPTPRVLSDADLVKFVTAHRALYQRGLLAWLRSSGNREGLNNMHRAMESLRQVATQIPAARSLWWIATAFIEALTQTKPDWSAQFKPFVSRIDRYMRDWVDGRDPDAAPLVRDLLYALARAEPVTKRIREVKELYKLDAQLPEYELDGTLEFDLPKLQPVLDDMKVRLTVLEDCWARYTSGEPHTLAQFREQSVRFKNLAKDLGAYHIRNLLDVMVLIASKLPDPYPPQREMLVLEMSAAFVLIERMLDTFTKLPADTGQQVTVMVGWLLDVMRPRGKHKQAPPALRDDITQRTNLKLIHAQVAKEIISNLQQIEQVIDAVSRHSAAPDKLAAARPFVGQVRGALDILGLHRANEVLSACGDLIERCTRTDHPALSQDLEWLAEGLTSLGFYLDEMTRGQSTTEEVLDFFLDRFKRRPLLVAVPGKEAGAPSRETEAAPQPQVTAPFADAAASPPPEPAVEVSAETAREREELLGVYIEEAQDVLATIESNLALLLTAPDNVDALTVIRRGFHTLKGSGRMVGLATLGELAWEIEQTMNQWLREIKPATIGLIELITQAKRLFAASVLELSRGTPLTLEHHDEVVSLAQSLRSGTAPVPAATPALSEVTIGTVSLSGTLFDIYRKEAATHLATLNAEFAAWQESPAPIIQHEFVRAAHTLGSSSRTTGFTAVAELAYALELWLQHLAGQPERVAADSVTSTGNAIAALARMLDDIEARRAPRAATAELDALQALLAAAQTQLISAPVQPIMVPAGLLARETKPSAGFIAVEPAAGLVTFELIAEPAEQEAAAPVEPARTAHAAPPPIVDDLDAQVLPMFLEEAAELLPQISSDLRAWQGEPGDVRLARALGRAVHTLKGSARIAGAIQIGTLAHALESRLGMAIEAGNPRPELFEALEADLDRLSAGIDRVRSESTRAAPAAPEPAAAPVPEAERAQPQASLRIEADRVDRLVNKAGEISIARTRIEGEMSTFKQSLLDLTDSVARLRSQLRETQIQADSQMQSRMSQLAEEDRQFDPLEFDRYSRLQELTRMMAESLHDVSLVQQTLLGNLKESETALTQQARVARDLQSDLLQLRSVPFATLAERLYRTVRQTAKELGKRATLEINGGEIEIDRSVLQRIGAPVEHILRNAIAHGIESPRERAAAGKPEIGQLTITLRQEGSEIAINLADDGAGLNFSAIRLEAIRNGLLAPSEEVDEAALAQMIFAPGFSTAREVTETYGRGIGMDVVRSDVAAVGGHVDVTALAGRGTTLTIYLPQSLAVAHALLVRAGDQTYAIPSTLVEQVQDLKPDVLERLYRSNAVEWQKTTYRVLYLPRLLGSDDRVADIKPNNAVVLLKSGTQRIALHVDELLRNQEIVLKPVGRQLGRVSGIVGATVLGNGQVVLIINPVLLALRANLSPQHAGATATRLVAEEIPAPLVMVVDDSLTVRQFTSRLLKRAGYRVATAKDGIDALQQMQHTHPDLLLLDIEMPRMDGFELTKQLRNDAATAAIPIIIITSRTADKHRAYALDLGANAFFGKPYPEDEMLRSIADLLDPDDGVPQQVASQN